MLLLLQWFSNKYLSKINALPNLSSVLELQAKIEKKKKSKNRCSWQDITHSEISKNHAVANILRKWYRRTSVLQDVKYTSNCAFCSQFTFINFMKSKFVPPYWLEVLKKYISWKQLQCLLTCCRHFVSQSSDVLEHCSSHSGRQHKDCRHLHLRHSLHTSLLFASHLLMLAVYKYTLTYNKLTNYTYYDVQTKLLVNVQQTKQLDMTSHK